MGISASRFVRRDLMCTDVPAGARFYTELFGWQTTELKVMGFTIVRLTAGDAVQGAIIPFDKSMGFPSHWVPYIYVESVDECCKRTAELGGSVCSPAMEIPPGRFALANDPQGALFSPFTPKGGAPPEPAQAPLAGTFCWDELMTSDVEGAKSFYTTLFGWTSEEKDLGAMGKVTVFRRGTAGAGGVMKIEEPNARPSWLSYVTVDDADASAARAEKLGAKISTPPTDIPTVGRHSIMKDPTGAAVAIIALVD
jgi:predicted enzyme related to lactoylglutathione lyase